MFKIETQLGAVKGCQRKDCPDGEGHSIKNNNDEPVVFLALVIYK